MASLHNQKKDNNQFKNKKQSELPENQTAWTPDNQEVKEEIFIQTSKRGREGQRRQRGAAKEERMSGKVGGQTKQSHICM